MRGEVRFVDGTHTYLIGIEKVDPYESRYFRIQFVGGNVSFYPFSNVKAVDIIRESTDPSE